MRILLVLLILAATPAMARDPLGVFGQWGAFRDTAPHRCFAIAEPEARREGAWRPFASVASWPGRRAHAQFHIRLRKARAPQTPVTLWIGPEQFPLVAGRADAWAPDERADAAIVRAMRSGEWMRVVARAASGGTFTDSYALRGAATAIDAAAIACARRR
jgi:hypothetical protein